LKLAKTQTVHVGEKQSNHVARFSKVQQSITKETMNSTTTAGTVIQWKRLFFPPPVNKKKKQRERNK
jgi:hypothetical protein